MRTSRLFFAVLPVACVACTFTGLGNYEVDPCPDPIGSPTTIAAAANPTYLTFSNPTGTDAIAAFVSSNNTSGACVQGVESLLHGGTGAIGSTVAGSSCPFFATTPNGGSTTVGQTLAPEQPWAASLGAGHAVAVIATTAPCTHGQVWFDYNAPAVDNYGSLEATCTSTGSSLPAIASLGGTTALAAWYETSILTRSDPIGSCSAAQPAPLVISAVNANANPVVATTTPVVLTMQSLSVRPASLVNPSSPPNSVLLAAPDSGSVSVWSLDASLKPAAPVTIPGLKGATSVSMATDGGSNIAVVAEINCAQSLALAIGSLAGGFSRVVTVADASAGRHVQPTVVWAQSQSQSYWLVSWIVPGGAHALAMRFDASGNPLPGGVIDSGVAAQGAGALAGGNLLALTSASEFVTASLGCAE